jgi:hypothetical protein
MHLQVHLHSVLTESLLIPFNLDGMCLLSIGSSPFSHLHQLLLGCHFKLKILIGLGERLNGLSVQVTRYGVRGSRDN